MTNGTNWNWGMAIVAAMSLLEAVPPPTNMAIVNCLSLVDIQYVVSQIKVNYESTCTSVVWKSKLS